WWRQTAGQYPRWGQLPAVWLPVYGTEGRSCSARWTSRAQGPPSAPRCAEPPSGRLQASIIQARGWMPGRAPSGFPYLRAPATLCHPRPESADARECTMAVMAMDGGGGYVPQPRAESQAHVVTATDTVENLADRYDVTPQALRDANPQLFQDPSARLRLIGQHGGDLLLTGETINIPAASQSVIDDPAGNDFVPNPTSPSANSEYSARVEGQHAEGSVTWNPGDGSV